MRGIHTVVSLVVNELGEPDRTGPWGLFVYLGGGQGALQLAQGTSKRMHELLRITKESLHGNWESARLVAKLCRSYIPPGDRP